MPKEEIFGLSLSGIAPRTQDEVAALRLGTPLPTLGVPSAVLDAVYDPLRQGTAVRLSCPLPPGRDVRSSPSGPVGDCPSLSPRAVAWARRSAIASFAKVGSDEVLGYWSRIFLLPLPSGPLPLPRRVVPIVHVRLQA